MTGALAAATPVAWLVARAAGLVAFGLLAVSITLGLALSTKLLGNRRGKMLLGWHQTLMWTALAMVGLHMIAVGLDPVMRFGVAALLVPGLAPWRPLPVAGGIVTAWLMLALAISFHVRRRIGRRSWRALHYASFGAFAIGLYHALNVGTDLVGARGLVFAGILVAPVCWLVCARILLPRPTPPTIPVRPATPVVATAARAAPRGERPREAVPG